MRLAQVYVSLHRVRELFLMRWHWSDLWRWRGTIDRFPYLLAGTALLVLKYALDWLTVNVLFGRSWAPLDYFVIPVQANRIAALAEEDRWLFGILLAQALPFVWMGVLLTVKRLRAAQLSPALVLFFFVPLVNLVFFLILGLLPSRRAPAVPPMDESHAPGGLGPGSERFARVYENYQRTESWRRLHSAHERITHGSPMASAAVSLGISVPLMVAFVALSTSGLGNYGWGLFVGGPFALGLGSVVLFGLARPQSFGACMAVAATASALVGVAVLAIALEGAICLIMAAPIGFVLTFLGAVVGYAIQTRPWSMQENPSVLLLLFFALPALTAAEAAAPKEPPLLEVRTEVDIDAPPERVWRQVISFPDLPPADEWLFRAGVACPLRAEIDGRGPGAVRYCIFSTGAFVEPIEVWDEPRLLRFAVAEQPEPMREWSPFDIHPPHLDHYLVSQRGQFRLTALPDGRTRLEGTTWYSNRMWPAAYWQLWSDAIIQRIHLRVLRHIKRLAEAEQPVSYGVSPDKRLPTSRER
jgi:hypothetical protein